MPRFVEGRPRLLPGDRVRVRSWDQVCGTLDAAGRLDGLPFMPEMRHFCGQTFVVSKRIERTCEEVDKQMRRIRDVVYLDDLRCDGSEHGGCQKGCFFVWKQAWLQPDGVDRPADEGSVGARPEDFPYEHGSPGGRYVCQSTELTAATSRLPWWDVGMVFRDIRARTYSPLELARIIAAALGRRALSTLTRRSYRYVQGTCARTPAERLNLQPGEWVRVKPKHAIAATLDAAGRNRGLTFTVEMLPFCGRTYRVLRRLNRMIHEPTGRLIDVEDTVILENVICDGCHILRGGCPRANYHYWREVWLERAGDRPAARSAAVSPRAAR